MGQQLPSRDEVRPDTPLRLGVAAALAFPDGSMTASGLRSRGCANRAPMEVTCSFSQTDHFGCGGLDD